MKKAIAILDPDCKELIPFLEAIRERKKNLHLQLEEMNKQIDKLRTDFEKRYEEDWEFLAMWLKTHNKLPEDFSKDKYGITFALEENAIYIEDAEEVKCDCPGCRGEHPDARELIQDIMKRMKESKEKKDE